MKKSGLKTKAKSIKNVDISEIEVFIGCLLIMSYNRVPAMKDYWSSNESLGNAMVKMSIARDRFLTIFSKLYFNQPDGEKLTKTYYVDILTDCLKQTFQRYRDDSPYQSIDESMTKFKGRSSMKQHMPMKPVKKGIKIWMRCDAWSGYTYDFNIYSGKTENRGNRNLGESVVFKLAEGIKTDYVTLCFDRFFSNVSLLEDIKYPAIGTIMANRKGLPDLQAKLAKGESEAKVSSTGLVYSHWKDTKDVYVISNCHRVEYSTVIKTQKNGSREEISCPAAIVTYREIMGGVDRADQMATYYEPDRKSTKWWKKVFFRLLMVSVVNAWIVYGDNNRKKITLLKFIVELAEQMIRHGKQTSNKKPETSTKPTSKPKFRHFPKKVLRRQRCKSCSNQKIERRTKQVCGQCNVALCVDCFESYHTKK